MNNGAFEQIGGSRNFGKHVNNPENRLEGRKNENQKSEFEAQKWASRISR